MKRISQISVVVGIILLIYQTRTFIVAHYQLEKNYTQLWFLADKSSTIPAKQKYISQFVTALETGYTNGDFYSHNAKWMKTPNNSFLSNLEALKSLSGRLNEIQEMNPSSFEYNTAIQQITSQEQGEAHQMLDVFNGCYYLSNYPLIWDWIGTIFICVWMVLLVGGGMCWMITFDD